MGFLNTLFGKKNKKTDVNYDYELADLTLEQKNYISAKLKEAEVLILKYARGLPPSKYDANTLDLVFEEWYQSDDAQKEKPEYVVEALGAAFGQDVIDSLNCEWKMLTDSYGSDLAVIHKTYQITGFPFSSAAKTYTENRESYFQEVKLEIKRQIGEAEKNGEILER
jgi:hypothetical protein